MLIHDDGGMAMPDLQTLIETRIPDHRNQLENSHVNLENVATYCEENYLNAANKVQAFHETKQFAIQSLASVAYQINTLARDLLDMLELQTDNIGILTHKVNVVSQVVDIHKEKLARREIGALTQTKNIEKLPKVAAPAVQEAVPKYKRVAIDFSVLDGVGHGVRTAEPMRAAIVSRASSTLSGATGSHFREMNGQHYGTIGPHHGNYERVANINTLSRSSLRSGHIPMASDYRVPQITPEQQRVISRQYTDEYRSPGSHSITTPNGSNHGSSDYGVMGDRYGTIRANNGGNTMIGHSSNRPSLFSMLDNTQGSPHDHSNNHRQLQSRLSVESDGLPLPPQQISTHRYGEFAQPSSNYGTLRANAANLPPPPDSLLTQSMHEDDMPLPPPPMASSAPFGGNEVTMFDTSTEWMPEGTYIEKAVVQYDYDAIKPDELTLRENAIVYVVRKNEDGWYEGVMDGVTGLFPGNYVKAI